MPMMWVRIAITRYTMGYAGIMRVPNTLNSIDNKIIASDKGTQRLITMT